MAVEMHTYEDVGLNVWVGEDFDERVLSTLEGHSKVYGDGKSGSHLYTVIVTKHEDPRAGLAALKQRLGVNAVRWVQLGVGALQHLEDYAAVQQEEKLIIGLEGYSAAQITTAAASLSVSSVQQEINLLVRPSRDSIDACEAAGCKFVAFGSLLGGLLSDRYLFQLRPVPDDEHSKQWDYLASIDGWGGWKKFQNILQVLRGIGDEVDRPISVVALAYLLQLPYVLSAIVGTRLGVKSQHRTETLAALQLHLSDSQLETIHHACEAGKITDSLPSEYVIN